MDGGDCDLEFAKATHIRNNQKNKERNFHQNSSKHVSTTTI